MVHFNGTEAQPANQPDLPSAVRLLATLGVGITFPSTHTTVMNPGNSVQFFDQQFQRQLAKRELQLNPF